MLQNSIQLTDNKLREILFAGRFGIEIEEHRVQSGSKSLSQHPHPRDLGNRQYQPYFQTDFSESQEELVTGTKHSSKDALMHLHELQTILASELAEDEIIWPLSMPPHLSANDIDYLLNHFERSWYQEYRDVLVKRYGPFKHIMAGIHVNFSPADDLVWWFGSQKEINSYPAAKNELYFQIAQQIASYRWLLTYLFGASPVSENSTDSLPTNFKHRQAVRSWRASNFGFANNNDIEIDYTNFETHMKQIQHYVDTGKFYDKSEFYGPVRLKAPGSLTNMAQRGASYLEFRMFDTNPFTLDGISQDALSFLHLLIIDAIINPQQWSDDDLKSAQSLNHMVALQHPNAPLIPSLATSAKQLIQRLEDIIKLSPAELQEDFFSALTFAKDALADPTKTIGAQLSNFISNDSLEAFALKRGQQILSERKSSSNNFVFAPNHLKQTYIQAHKLGFKTLLRKDNCLQISQNDHVWTFTKNTDLTNYVKTKK